MAKKIEHIYRVEERDGVKVVSYTVAGTAAMLRKALKAAFPGVKFSVRSQTYSGGASIDVEYTDGPALSDVEALCDTYRKVDFDGMTDSTSYRAPTLIALDGEDMPVLARWGSHYVMAQQSFSPARMAALIERIEATGVYSNTWTPGLLEVDIEDEHLVGGNVYALARQLHGVLAAAGA
jgi:hypothetical protein